MSLSGYDPYGTNRELPNTRGYKAMRKLFLLIIGIPLFCQDKPTHETTLASSRTVHLTVTVGKDMAWVDFHVYKDGKDVAVASATPDGEWKVSPGLSRETLEYAIGQLLKSAHQMNQFSMDRQKEDAKKMNECLAGWKLTNDALDAIARKKIK